MSTEVAQAIVISLTGIGFVVWLIGLRFLLVTSRIGKVLSASETGELSASGPRSENCLLGSADVEGEPSALMEKALSLLAKMGSLGPGSLGPLKIVERTKERIVFERIGLVSPGQAYASGYRQGILRFTMLDKDRTRIDYAIELAQGRWLLWLGWLFQLAGLVALSVGCWAVYTFCVTSPDPAVRAQSVQMVQAVHFIWPPFLFGALYRQRKNLVFSTFEALIHNLPYYSAG